MFVKVISYSELQKATVTVKAKLIEILKSDEFVTTSNSGRRRSYWRVGDASQPVQRRRNAYVLHTYLLVVGKGPICILTPS